MFYLASKSKKLVFEQEIPPLLSLWPAEGSGTVSAGVKKKSNIFTWNNMKVFNELLFYLFDCFYGVVRNNSLLRRR